MLGINLDLSASLILVVNLIVAVIVTVIAGLLTEFFSKKRKELSWHILINSSFLTQAEYDELRNILNAPANNQSLSQLDIHSVVLRISNTGGAPIARDDFDQDIEFTFGTNVKVITATVIRSKPHYLPAKTVCSASAVKLERLLLNPQQGVEIRVLTQGVSEVEAQGNIQGGTIRKRSDFGETKITLFRIVDRFADFVILPVVLPLILILIFHGGQLSLTLNGQSYDLNGLILTSIYILSLALIVTGKLYSWLICTLLKMIVLTFLRLRSILKA